MWRRQELNRAEDRPRHCHHKTGEEFPHIEQAMEPQWPALGIGGFERETVRHLGWRETHAVAGFQHRPVMPADHLVLGLETVYRGILERFQRAQRKTAVVNAVRIMVEPPAGADVIMTKKVVAPGCGVDHVAIPLDQQHMLGFDIPEQVLDDEARICRASSQGRRHGGRRPYRPPSQR